MVMCSFNIIAIILGFSSIIFGIFDINERNQTVPLIDNCTNIHYNDTSITCSSCELITGVIAHEIKMSNDTIVTIEKLVRNLCKHLGTKPVAKECYVILHNIDKIVHLIEKGLEPGRICCKLGFCNNKNELLTPSKI